MRSSYPSVHTLALVAAAMALAACFGADDARPASAPPVVSVVSVAPPNPAARPSTGVHFVLVRRPDRDDTWIRDLAFHPHEAIFAAADTRGLIRIYDASSGAVLRSLSGHRGAATVVAFSRDGSRIAAGGEDGHVLVWDAKSGVLALDIPAPAPLPKDRPLWPVVTSLAWNADGTRLLTGTRGGQIRLHDAATGALIRAIQGPTTTDARDPNVRGLAYSPDGSTFLSSGTDCVVRLWNADGSPRTELRLFGRCEKLPEEPTFSPDGSTVAILTNGLIQDRTIEIRWAGPKPTLAAIPSNGIYLFDLAFRHALACEPQFRAIDHLSYGGYAMRLAWSPDGSRVAMGWQADHVAENAAGAIVLDTRTCATVASLPVFRKVAEPGGQLEAIAWSPDGNVIAFGGPSGLAMYRATTDPPTPRPRPTVDESPPVRARP
ncbi:MAG TPA: hypothetical protein VGH28_25600 [Polyangiaceae bacterium]